jgi:hypothetical protein
MNRSHIRVAAALSGLTLLALAGSVQAQILADGNLDALTPGTAPDCTTPAGAWMFPATYIAASLCEQTPDQFTIVPTASFDPGHAGNSLHLVATTDNATFMHLPNLFTSVINEAPGLIVRVSFRIWVSTAGTSGGSVYVGGDHGGGGYVNTSDRGPQIIWQADGAINARDTVGFVPMVASYPNGAWQQVQLVIDLTADTFDFLWAPAGQPLARAATGLHFRSGTQNHLDRFTYVHFGDQALSSDSYIDDITVTACAADYNGDGVVNVQDFLAYVAGYAAADARADFDGNGSINVQDFLAFLAAYAAGC